MKLSMSFRPDGSEFEPLLVLFFALQGMQAAALTLFQSTELGLRLCQFCCDLHPRATQILQAQPFDESIGHAKVTSQACWLHNAFIGGPSNDLQRVSTMQMQQLVELRTQLPQLLMAQVPFDWLRGKVDALKSPWHVFFD